MQLIKRILFLLLLFSPKLIVRSLFILMSTISFAADQTSPININADKIESIQGEETQATGEVVAKWEDTRLDAQWAHYQTDTNHLLAGDTVVLEKSGDVVIGKHLDLLLDTYQGQISKPIYFAQNQSGRADADILSFAGKNRYLLHKGRYTTCDISDDSWYIRGQQIDLDFNTQDGTARHAVFEFKGIPLFYTPWLTFPLNRQRRSGILVPIIGSSSNSGITLGVPYYWNIAPNYDATITPKYFSKRGIMLGNEFRYLQPTYSGTLRGEYLPRDQKMHENRYSWQIRHVHHLGSNLSVSADLQGVSDAFYFTDFANNLQQSSTVNLPRDILLNYRSNSWWTTSIRSQRYQTLENGITPIVKPYGRAPQVLFQGTLPLKQPYNVELIGEFNRFIHPTFISADRLIAYPKFSLPLEKSYGFIRPQIGVHATFYSLQQDEFLQQRRLSRILPIYSIDTGLIFERSMRLAQKNFIQTLEPRLYYVYIPYKNQSKMPNFDSALVDFSFTQMFRETQFTGGDRINNANQLTAAISNLFYDADTGLERLRLQLGQRFYFTDQKVSLSTPLPLAKQTRSDLLLSGSSEIWPNFNVAASWQYNAQNARTNKSQLELAWNPDTAKILNMRYLLNRTDPYNPMRQFDISLQWPIFRNWYAVGRYNYSIQDKKTLDTIAGLQYNSGCWGVQFIVQRYLVDANSMNSSFYLVLHLKDLHSIGSSPIRTLQERIPGYSQID